MEGSTAWLRESLAQVCCRHLGFWEWLGYLRSHICHEEGLLLGPSTDIITHLHVIQIILDEGQVTTEVFQLYCI